MYNDYKAGKANEHNQTVADSQIDRDREIKTVLMSSLVQSDPSWTLNDDGNRI